MQLRPPGLVAACAEPLRGTSLLGFFAFEQGGKHYLFDGETLCFARIQPGLHRLFQEIATNGLPPMAGSDQSGGSEFLRLLRRRAEAPAEAGISRGSGRAAIQEVYVGLTEHCNLACTYCYTQHFEQVGRGRRMSPATAARVAAWIVEGVPAHGRCSVVLWGGEPLLNWAALEVVVREASRLAAAKPVRLRFATTTNGTLLDPRRFAFLAEHRVVVNLSIDGSQEIHDANRPDRRGRPTYERIAENLESIRASRPARLPGYWPIARATLSRDSVAHLADSARSVWALGIPQVWFKEVAYDPDRELDDASFPVLAAQLAEWRRLMLDRVREGRVAEVAIQLRAELTPIHHRQKVQGACRAGLNTVFVDAQGEVHACYNLIDGAQPSRIGHTDAAELDPVPQQHWRRLIEQRWAGCAPCPFKHLCGGGCLAKSRGRPEPAESECRFNQVYQEHRLRLYAEMLSDFPDEVSPHLAEAFS